MVKPNVNKVNLPALSADLPKYHQHGLSEVEVQWWKAYIQFLEDTWTQQQQCTEYPDQWPLPDIIDIRKRAKTSVTHSAAYINQHISRLREAELAPAPEVCCTICVNMNSVDTVYMYMYYANQFQS